MAIDDEAEAPSLYERVVRRDRGALAHAYEEFGSSVWFAARRVGSERCADAVTAEVFLVLWDDPEQYDGSASLGKWLVGLASARALGWSERSEHAADVPLDEPPVGLDQSWMNAIHTCFGHDTEVYNALVDLPAEECKAITLALLGQQNCKQIARTLQIDEATTKRHLRVGLGRLASRQIGHSGLDDAE